MPKSSQNSCIVLKSYLLDGLQDLRATAKAARERPLRSPLVSFKSSIGTFMYLLWAIASILKNVYHQRKGNSQRYTIYNLNGLRVKPYFFAKQVLYSHFALQRYKIFSNWARKDLKKVSHKSKFSSFWCIKRTIYSIIGKLPYQYWGTYFPFVWRWFLAFAIWSLQ